MTGVDTEGDRITAIDVEKNGQRQKFACDRLISTMPSTLLGRMLGHEFNLRFQSIKLVFLNIAQPLVMPYHWVYFGDSDVVINRMSEFKNFAREGVPKDRTVVVAEVTLPSEDPLEDVLQALERYKLVDRNDVLDSLLLHEKFAYPVYDRYYEKAMEQSRKVFGRFDNLHLVGRSAEFRHIEVDETFASAVALVRQLTAAQHR